MRTATTAKFRYNISIALAGLLALLGAVPLATSGFGSRDGDQPWYAYPLLLILIIPIAVMVWGVRAGTDADAEGVRTRPSGLASRRISWTEIVGIVPQGRKVYAALRDERAVPLPAVTRADVPRLVAAAGATIQGGPGAPDDVAGDPDGSDIESNDQGDGGGTAGIDRATVGADDPVPVDQ